MTVIKKIHKALQILENIFMIVPLIIIFLLVMYQVVSRYMLNTNLIWGDEMVTFLTILMAMTGSAIAVREKAHTDLTLFLDKAPKPLSSMMKVLANILTVCFFLMLIFSGIRYAVNSLDQTAITLGISMAIPYSFIPIGAFLMLVEFILMKLHISDTDKVMGSAENFL